jgi:membrane protein DedA with SNARE-associated domain
MGNYLRPLFIIALVLLVPIVPFCFLGDGFERELENWFSQRISSTELAWTVVLLLASDIVLPIPSSLLSTLAGSRLGILNATCLSWLGMMIGSILGFGLARWIGPPLVQRFAGAEDLESLHRLAKHYGALTLAITRPLPIFAEAAVLLLGMSRLSWKTFLTVACLSNGAIALVYACLGWFAFQQGHLAIALAASLALPLFATLVARRLLPKDDPPTVQSNL